LIPGSVRLFCGVENENLLDGFMAFVSTRVFPECRQIFTLSGLISSVGLIAP
jgi:hypothetical protein